MLVTRQIIFQVSTSIVTSQERQIIPIQLYIPRSTTRLFVRGRQATSMYAHALCRFSYTAIPFTVKRDLLARARMIISQPVQSRLRRLNLSIRSCNKGKLKRRKRRKAQKDRRKAGLCSFPCRGHRFVLFSGNRKCSMFRIHLSRDQLVNLFFVGIVFTAILSINVRF